VPRTAKELHMIADDSLQHLFADAKEHHLNPLWTNMQGFVTPKPSPHAIAHIWRYAEVRPLLDRAGDLVAAEDAERRVLMLTNPALTPPHTTDTLFAGLQLIRPGELARAHRHMAFALRFIVEGKHAFTAVGGEKVTMMRGDLVLTPPWEFHDHGNESDTQMIWLDGLDLPLLAHIRVNFAQNYEAERYPSTDAAGPSRLKYPWAEMQAQLDAATGDTAMLDYAHREHGGAIGPTIGAAAVRVNRGASTKTARETASSVYHVYEGRGTSQIGDASIAWQQGDTFCAPSWMPVTHRNDGDSNAYLFRFDDRPTLRALGWYRTDDQG
jgi:gentisate 1,2-dioxygenase